MSSRSNSHINKTPEIEVLPRMDQEPNPQKQMRALAVLLDSAFTIPGTQMRFGIDSLIGLIPGIGDVIGAAISSYIILLAAKAGASRLILTKMIFNVAVEAVVGIIPILGDIFDIAWKANMRNVALFESSKLESITPSEGQKRLSQTLSLLIIVGSIFLITVILLVLFALIWIFRWILL